MTKHTPGPWHYLGDSLTHRQFDIYSPGAAPQKHVCTVNNLSNEALWKRDAQQAEANARLIAAAPAMLAALQAVADYWAGGDVPAEIDAQMREAIASATGAAP